MLPMAVIEHGAETCAAVHPHIGDLARQGMGDLESIGKKHGWRSRGRGATRLLTSSSC